MKGNQYWRYTHFPLNHDGKIDGIGRWFTAFWGTKRPIFGVGGGKLIVKFQGVYSNRKKKKKKTINKLSRGESSLGQAPRNDSIGSCFPWSLYASCLTLLMVQKSHSQPHVMVLKPYKKLDIYHMNWCRIFFHQQYVINPFGMDFEEVGCRKPGINFTSHTSGTRKIHCKMVGYQLDDSETLHKKCFFNQTSI